MDEMRTPTGAESAPTVEGLMRLGRALARTPPEQRNLDWHVKAAFLGDFPALVAARIRADRGPA